MTINNNVPLHYYTTMDKYQSSITALFPLSIYFRTVSIINIVSFDLITIKYIIRLLNNNYNE